MNASLPLPEVLNRIRAEFVEMPGLRLTAAQAQRLWNVDSLTCEALLAALVETGFLYRDANGRYSRTSGSVRATTTPSVTSQACLV
jgi:hypothetical protein